MKDTENILKLKNASKEELSSKVMEMKKSLMNLRFAHGTGSLKDTSLINKTKKNIARLKSFMPIEPAKSNKK